MAELATLLARAEKHAKAAVILRKGAVQTTDAGFAEVAAFARELCAKGKTKAGATAAPVTFRKLGEQ